MKHEETLEPITDCYNSGAPTYEAPGDIACPAICTAIHPYPLEPRQRPTAPGRPFEPTFFPASERLENPAGIQAHPSWSLRGVAEVSVRVAMLMAIIWFVLVWTGVAIPTQKYHEHTIDFSRQLVARGGSSLPSTLPSVIPCAPLDLVIYLGRGNQPGPFDVALVQDGMRYAFASGIAKLESHVPILRVKLDLSQAPLGESQMGIRPAGGEWKFYKIILQSAH